MLPSMRECFKPEESIEWNRASTSWHWYQKKDNAVWWKQCDIQRGGNQESVILWCLISTEDWQNHWVNYSPSIPHISKDQSKSLIKKICQDHTSKLNTPAVAWGRDHEELAIKIYTDVSSNKNSQFKSKCISDVVIHTDVDVRSFGLQISPWKTMVWSFHRQCDIL